MAVDGGLLTAQDIQVPGTVVQQTAFIQVLDKDGLSPKSYQWYPANYINTTLAGRAFTDATYTIPFKVPEGKNGVWAVQTQGPGHGASVKYWYEVLDQDLEPADAVLLYTRDASVPMTTAGAVPDENIVVFSIAGNNYVGNPFPAAITAQDIQVPGTVVQQTAFIQVLDKDGLSPKSYQWYPASYINTTLAGRAFTDATYTIPFKVPEGKNGVWAVQTQGPGHGASVKYWYEALNKELASGESLMLYTRDAEVDITITCPYDLKADK